MQKNSFPFNDKDFKNKVNMGTVKRLYTKKRSPTFLGLGFNKEIRRTGLSNTWSYKTKIPIITDEDFKERRRHTLPHNCSTICAGGLNFSVRDGKR